MGIASYSQLVLHGFLCHSQLFWATTYLAAFSPALSHDPLRLSLMQSRCMRPLGAAALPGPIALWNITGVRKRLQNRADVYIKDMPICCLDIVFHRLNVLNCMMEGMHDLKLQNESRLDMEKGFRDETEKKIIYIYFYSKLFFIQPYTTREACRTTGGLLPLGTPSGEAWPRKGILMSTPFPQYSTPPKS